MKNISIPEPCSENWNEMTPTQRGAFCQKCALDLYDFTNKSGSEIRTILSQNIGGRICGRIENVQLAELNSDFQAWQINNSRSFQRAWIFTLFVVFGLTLFSCEEEDVAEKMQRVGQQILTEQVADFQKRTATEGKAIAGNAMMEREMMIGEADEPMQSAPLIETFEGHDVTMGKFVEDVVYVDNPRTESVPEEVHDLYTLGGMWISTSYTEYLHESTPTDSDGTCTVMSGLMYPNPATNESTLKLQMPDNGKVEINLYGLNGQHLREVHSGRVAKGETEFGLDLTDLKAGLYLVVIVSENKKETVKFTKI